MRQSEAIVAISEAKEDIKAIKRLVKQYETVLEPETIDNLSKILTVLVARIEIATKVIKAS